MPPPDPHYTLLLINHETRERLKIEMVELPFPGARSTTGAPTPSSAERSIHLRRPGAGSN